MLVMQSTKLPTGFSYEKVKMPFIPVADGPDHFLNKTQVMVDLETLDTSPTSAIWQYGIVIWNPTESDYLHKFQLTINPNIALGSISDETIAWQFDNNTENFHLAKQLPEVNVDVDRYVADFVGLVNNYIETGKESKFWSKSITFDFPILEHTIVNIIGMEKFWSYWNVHELRTLMMLKGIPNRSFSHEAVEDAYRQMIILLNEFSG